MICLTSLLVTVHKHSLTVSYAVRLLLFTIYSCFIPRAQAPASASSGNSTVILFSAFFAHNYSYLQRTRPVHNHFGLVLCSYSEGRYRFLYVDATAGSVFCRIPSSSCFVTSTCGGRSLTRLRAMAMDSESAGSTRESREPWEQDLFSSGHSSRRLYCQLFGITSHGLSIIEYDRNGIPSLIFGDHFLALASIPSVPAEMAPIEKAFLVFSMTRSSLIAVTVPKAVAPQD